MRFNDRTKYLVIDEVLEQDILIENVKKALDNGIELVQYNSNKVARDMIKEANCIKSLCAKYKAVFLVKNRIDVAMAINADGVHLDYNDMSILDVKNLIGNNKIIGFSVKNENDLFLAREERIDYITLSEDFDYSLSGKEVFNGNIYGDYNIIKNGDITDLEKSITGVYLKLDDLSYTDINAYMNDFLKIS